MQLSTKLRRPRRQTVLLMAALTLTLTACGTTPIAGGGQADGLEIACRLFRQQSYAWPDPLDGETPEAYQARVRTLPDPDNFYDSLDTGLALREHNARWNNLCKPPTP